ncbi:putative choline/Carnitine o-acyltransferase [Lyophyllum shimeji]|uniref:Choline/Carnitine o-acyltransferase n=1 Tax=Lyophyllum shimeji TaxID=47721 RepID=A0A9P3PS46_LYOSH|nr:putative choline/Carnitine o-acyltransferase [Lyophyllum shimeji]
MRDISTNSLNSAQRARPSLPRLPVPDLRQTLDRYLASLEPLLLEDERLGKASYESSYAFRVQKARAFERGIGKVLQDRLLALDRASLHNWLDDNFWMDKAYLEWRAPLLINSNWWLAFHDDDLLPESAKTGESSDSRAGITLWQIRRAAWLIHRVLDYKGQLDTGELHSETTRTGIWLRQSISKMFNIARIPTPLCDIISPSPPADCPDARKLLLTLHNWFYAIPVYHPPNSPNDIPKLMEPREIESQIRAVVLDVEQRLANGDTATPVGVLSADDRDRWAANQQHLLSIHPTNRKSYQKMLSSVMGLSLDHMTHTIPPGPRTSYSPEGISQEVLDAHLHTIRAHALNVANRFYDKPFTLIVDSSTRAGATGEHAPCDALVPSIVAEYGIVEGVDESAFSATWDEREPGGWERLDWVADEKIQKECVEAHARAVKIIEDSDDSVLWFGGYGTDWIKGIAKLAPDAYIQMVLQLAWYKTRGEFTATYETVLTRMFKHGRTETLRTVTRDSRAWVLAMMDPQCAQETRYKALQRAIQTHTRLTREAATGRGIDRHLLGLRLMMRPHEGEESPLFNDELFERSQQWKLSTSGLSAGHLFRGTGFGAVYDDGYGINYLAAPSMIKFGIESKFSSPLTSTEKFKQTIVECLYEMRFLCSLMEAINSYPVTSHL